MVRRGELRVARRGKRPVVEPVRLVLAMRMLLPGEVVTGVGRRRGWRWGRGVREQHHHRVVRQQCLPARAVLQLLLLCAAAAPVVVIVFLVVRAQLVVVVGIVLLGIVTRSGGRVVGEAVRD